MGELVPFPARKKPPPTMWCGWCGRPRTEDLDARCECGTYCWCSWKPERDTIIDPGGITR